MKKIAETVVRKQATTDITTIPKIIMTLAEAEKGTKISWWVNEKNIKDIHIRFTNE